MGLLDDIGAFANPFGTPSVGQWNLTKAVFTSSTNKQLVLFYEEKGKPPAKVGGITRAASDDLGETKTNLTALEQITDSGGRRLAVFEYPYVGGQRVKDLGRKGETYVFNLKFFGNNYQQKYRDFIDIVAGDSGQGTLLHPVLSAVRGAIKVKLKDYEPIHRHDEWNAVTIRATFIEDNTNEIELQTLPTNTDSALRSLLQTMTDVQAAITAGISDATAILGLPASIENAMKQRLQSLVNQVSGFLGQLAATFSSNAQLKSLAAQANAASSSIAGLNAGTVTQNVGGSSTLAKLPPVFQVGFDPSTQAAIVAQSAAYVNANQITPQQAVFSANQARAGITTAINEAVTNFGNLSFDVVLQYRTLAVSIQTATESSLAATQSLVKIYTTPIAMSLRKIAYANGLSADRQNDIEALNPYLPSVNYVPKGTQVTVPAS